MKHRAQRGLRLRQAYARTQARHHFEPIVVLLEVYPRISRFCPYRKQQIGVQRNVEIRRRCGIYAEESRWSDSRNGERNVID